MVIESKNQRPLPKPNEYKDNGKAPHIFDDPPLGSQAIKW
jgi:hypothetical protein